MAKFPKSEQEIITLATSVKEGLDAHVDIYPAPPVQTIAIETVLDSLHTVIAQTTEARAAAEAATEQKLALLETLAELIKRDIRYAENTVGNDDVKLKYLGWGARKDPTPTTPPGQAQQLVVYPQGEAWLELRWLAPAQGGKVTSYTVQRRLRSETAWTEIASTYERTITLTGQPREVELEYSVYAANKAGNGPVSNTVMVVL